MPTLEQALQTLAATGTLVKDRGYRQVWRFEADGRGYYLKFYPRRFGDYKRIVRGSSAMVEFQMLQRMQKAHIPAPRAVACLVGFKLGHAVGDAVVLEALEPATPLDEFLSELRLRGEDVPDHLALGAQIRELLLNLKQAGLGHRDLHLGNFLLHNGQIYLLDGYALHRGGLRRSDLMVLAHSVARFATRTDLVRGWRDLGTGSRIPRRNPASPRLWRKVRQRATGDNRYFGRLTIGDWSGFFFKSTKFPRRWAAASQLQITREDWQSQFPLLLQNIESNQLEFLKQSKSGDVLAGDVRLGGESVSIVVKRPYKRYWYRYLNEIGRGSRAHRAWKKAWTLVALNIPTAWPLVMMERRRFGYVTDSIVVFQRVPGPTLAEIDLDALGPEGRDRLLRRTGRILRMIEQFGYAHFDAKASNWIAADDPILGPRPILIDVDGIRHRRWIALGIRRLLRSMKDHPHYSPDDSLHLCQGYAPFSKGLIRRKD